MTDMYALLPLLPCGTSQQHGEAVRQLSNHVMQCLLLYMCTIKTEADGDGEGAQRPFCHLSLFKGV